LPSERGRRLHCPILLKKKKGKGRLLFFAPERPFAPAARERGKAFLGRPAEGLALSTEGERRDDHNSQSLKEE